MDRTTWITNSASRMRRPLTAIAAICLLAGTAGAIAGASAAGAVPGRSTGTAAPGRSAAAVSLSRIRHVWIIDLENVSYAQSFGHPSADPYLAQTLVRKGALLKGYYGIGHDSLDNYIAEISGQAPNFQTGADCYYFSPFLQFGGETFSKFTKYGQLSGDGCVYPRYVQNIASQLSARHLNWRAYEQDMGNDPKRDGTTPTAHGPTCGHPPVGAVDQTEVSGPANDSYATRHDPFVYFLNVIGNQQYCANHVVGLNLLPQDLRRAAATPSYSFITPDTCFDGHDIPTCQNGSRGGFPRVDEFLRSWVPRIMASPAYRDGLIFITFDESGVDQDAGACCGEKLSRGFDDPSHPDTNIPGLWGPGGGRVGAVALSPFIRPGTISTAKYNHYSLLKTVERIFGLGLIGDAKQPQVHAFGRDVFTH